MTAWRFSLAPLGEPGSVIIKVPFLTPATGLDIMATYQSVEDLAIRWTAGDSQGVTLREAASIPWTRPGACLCRSADTACTPIS